MTVRDERLAPWPRTPADTRRQLADYYACVTGLDHHVGRIFAELKAAGQWDDTLVVFTGDNGLSLGEHGLFGKQNLYEFGGMHVPLVVAGPGVAKGRSDALVYLMDLFPTFADFAGAAVPAGVEGRSLRPDRRGQGGQGPRRAVHGLPRLPAQRPRRPLEAHPLPAGGPDAALRPGRRPARDEQPRRPARERGQGGRDDRPARTGDGPPRRQVPADGRRPQARRLGAAGRRREGAGPARK